MNNVVSLFDYRKQREKEELDELEVAVNNIIAELGDEFQPQPYFGYDSVYSHNAGMYSQAGIALNDIISCCSTLRWISYVLATLGRVDEAGDIDNIITRLEVATNGE